MWIKNAALHAILINQSIFKRQKKTSCRTIIINKNYLPKVNGSSSAAGQKKRGSVERCTQAHAHRHMHTSNSEIIKSRVQSGDEQTQWPSLIHSPSNRSDTLDHQINTLIHCKQYEVKN